MTLMMSLTVTGSPDRSNLHYSELLYGLSNVSVKGHDPVTVATARFTAAHHFLFAQRSVPAKPKQPLLGEMV